MRIVPFNITLRWFGHVSCIIRACQDNLTKNSSARRERRRGQWKRWENSIFGWTGLKFCDAVRESEKKIKWRERVARSMALQRSPWLRRRGWCRWSTFHWHFSKSLKIFLGNQIVRQAPLTKTSFVATKALKGLPHTLKLQIIWLCAVT